MQIMKKNFATRCYEKAPRPRKVFVTFHKVLTETLITISRAFRVYYFNLGTLGRYFNLFLPVSCPSNKL